jgi:hypothetical protein
MRDAESQCNSDQEEARGGVLERTNREVKEDRKQNGDGDREDQAAGRAAPDLDSTAFVASWSE